MRISDWSSDVCSSDLDQPGDDAERAFRANEQLLQIIAGVILDHLVQRRNHPAIGEHGLDAEHLFAHHAIADDAHAAGVGRGIAAELARTAPAKIERKGEPVPSEPGFERFEHHTRSEERRGGKEWVSTCRSRWAP